MVRISVPDLPILKCAGCGETLFTNASDDAITAATGIDIRQEPQ